MKFNLIWSGPLFLLITVTSTAWAQSGIYRCGNSYSQTPCIGGQEIAVDARRPPSAKIESDRTNERISHEADAMEKARMQREGDVQKQLNLVAARKDKTEAPVAATASNTPSDSSGANHSKLAKKKPATPKPFTAKAPASAASTPKPAKASGN